MVDSYPPTPIAEGSGGAATASNQTSGSQKTQLVTPSNTSYDTVTGSSGGKYLGVGVIQDAHVSTENSSTANLLAGGSFTGTSVNTLGVNSIQVVLKTDQNCYLYIDQSPDGTNWDISDRYYFNKTSGNFSRTVQAVASYVRVRVTNLNSTTATTYFRLQTVLCPMADPVIRTVDEDGHSTVGIQGIADNAGNDVFVTPAHMLQVIEPVRLVGSTFSGSSLDTNFWTAVTSVGTVGISNSVASLTTGTSNGHAQISSARTARFVFGVPNRFRAVIRIPDITETGNIRRWGVATVSTVTPQDGYYFELSADGVLSFVTCKGGTPSPISSGSFNGKFSEYTLDTNRHHYEIVYWTQDVQFYIDGVLMHTFTPTDSVLSNTLHLPILCSNVGPSTGAEPAVLEVWNAAIYRLGKISTGPQVGSISGNAATYTFKIGPGMLHRLIFNNTSGTSVAIYDNTTAAVPLRATITTASAALGVWNVEMPFNTGLVIVTTGNGLDMTVVYE